LFTDLLPAMSGAFPNDGPYAVQKLPKQETTNNWETLGRPLDVRGLMGAFLLVQKEASNYADVRVKASLDFGENYDVTLQGPMTFTSSAVRDFRFTQAVSHIKVEVTAAQKGNQTDVEAALGGFAPEAPGGGVYPHDGVYTLHRLGPQLSTNSLETLERTLDVRGARNVFIRAVNENVNGNVVNVAVEGKMPAPELLGGQELANAAMSLSAGGVGTSSVQAAFQALNIQIAAVLSNNHDEVSAKVGVKKYPSAA
jgi:hypothetical protein